MREQFIEKTFSAEALTLIDFANARCTEMMELGYRLSLRQLFYQFVAANALENNVANYKKLGELVTDARMAGLIDWDAIEDRGRQSSTPPTWDCAEDIIKQAIDSFRMDKWADQPCHVRVMIEKDALSGIVGPVCEKAEVPFHMNKGYSSASALYECGKEIQSQHRLSKRLVIIYAGDYDPSGLAMTHDVATRLSLFSQSPVEVVRVALTAAQIERYNPPANQVKESDPRARAYIEQHGHRKCWEVDALSPLVLAKTIEKAISHYRDENIWQDSCDKEEEQRERIQDVLDGQNPQK